MSNKDYPHFHVHHVHNPNHVDVMKQLQAQIKPPLTPQSYLNYLNTRPFSGPFGGC